MVYMQGDWVGDDGLPNQGYGFYFGNDPKKAAEEQDNVLIGDRFPDSTVWLPNKKDGSTMQVTHRFTKTANEECEGVKILEGQTYAGSCAGDEKLVIGKISAVFFEMDNMSESLQMAADCITQELYDAMETLFAYNGSPKGPFKKKLNETDFSGILYIGGVYVKKSKRGNALGLEIVRSLIASLMDSLAKDDDGESPFCDLALLCPAADPHPGSPDAWNYAFDSLSAMFEKVGFQRCGGKNRRSGQSKFMFINPMEHAWTPPEVRKEKKQKKATCQNEKVKSADAVAVKSASAVPAMSAAATAKPVKSDMAAVPVKVEVAEEPANSATTTAALVKSSGDLAG